MKKDTKKTEIVEVQTPVTPSEISVPPNQAIALLQYAIDKSVPVETMERLLVMRDKIEAAEAKKAFDAAMAAFQAECPLIEKTKEVKNDSGKLLYKYAPLDSIVSQVKELLGKYGFSYAITTEMTLTHVRVICTAKHVMGHSEPTDVNMPLATKTGIMSAPQQMASTLTFGKRYAFCNAFGIMTGDEDVDANKESAEIEVPKVPTAPVTAPVAPVQAAVAPKVPLAEKDRPALMRELHALLKKYGMPHKAFNDAYQVDSMANITDDQIKTAIGKLRERTENGEVWRDPSVPVIDVDATPTSPVTPATPVDVIQHAPLPASAIVTENEPTKELTQEQAVEALGGKIEKELSPGMQVAKEQMERTRKEIQANERIQENMAAG